MPTQPATPEPNKRNRLTIPFPVPVIAPPHDHVPRLPLSDDATAKVRLLRLLEREEKTRARDHLDSQRSYARRMDLEAKHGKEHWEDLLGIGEDLRSEIIAWLLEVSASLLFHPLVADSRLPRRSRFTIHPRPATPLTRRSARPSRLLRTPGIYPRGQTSSISY